MTIVRRKPAVLSDMWNDWLTPDWFGGTNQTHNLPAVNIREAEKEFYLEFAIPGKKKEDFNVEVDDNLLTVSMENKEEREETDKGYTRREFNYSAFKRAFTLPETVDADKIEAKYENGILKFSLPKKQEALPKPKRLIEIAGK